MYLFKPMTLRLLLIAVATALWVGSEVWGIYWDGIMIDLGITAERLSDIIVVMLVYGGIHLINIIVGYVRTVQIETMIEQVVYRFKMDILCHLQRIDTVTYHSFESAYLSKRIDDDIREYVMLFVHYYALALLRGIELVVVTVLLFRIDFWIGVTILVAVPLFYGIDFLFKKRVRERDLARREENARFFGHFTNQFENLEHVVTMGNLDGGEAFLKERFGRLLKLFKRLIFVQQNLRAFNYAALTVMTFFLWIIAGARLIEGSVTAGSVLVATLLYYRNLGVLSFYVNLRANYQVTMAAVGRINELMDIPQVPEGDTQKKGIHHISGTLTYAIEGRTLMTQQSVDLRKGQLTAITGSNGAGKTTLLKLLLGVIKAKPTDELLVAIDGEPLATLDSFYLRQHNLAYLPQQIPLLHMSVAEVFNQHGTYDTPEQALKSLKSLGFSLDTGMDCLLVERWSGEFSALSGGEKQLLYMLANLLKPADFFVFDEPTANLDKEKLAWVRGMLLQLKQQDKMVVVINHEQSLADIFDQVIQLGRWSDD